MVSVLQKITSDLYLERLVYFSYQQSELPRETTIKAALQDPMAMLGYLNGSISCIVMVFGRVVRLTLLGS